MPFKLLIVVLADVALVALSAYEAWTAVLDPMDCIFLGCGLMFLYGLARGREWARPLGMTLAGVLLIQAMVMFFGRGCPEDRRLSIHTYNKCVTTEFLIIYPAKFVYGWLLLWVMRHRDAIAWIVQRSGFDDVA